MKNTFLLAICLFVTYQTMYGQKHQIGLVAGPSLFTIYDKYNYPSTDSFEEDLKWGTHAAFIYRNELTDRWALQTELNYTQKGWSLICPSCLNGSDSQSKRTMHFIEIPILFRYKILKTTKSSLDIGMGLGLGRTLGKMKIASKNLSNGEKDVRYYEYRGLDVTNENGEQIGAPTIYHGLDLDLIAGISYCYRVNGKLSILTGIREQYDFLTPMGQNQHTKETMGRFITWNTGGVLYAGFAFSLGSKGTDSTK